GYYISHEGAGSFTVSGGGYVLGNAWIGSDTTGSGTVLITGAGSHWLSIGDFSVGDVGTGDFTIADGGLAESGNAMIGFDTGGLGTALVTGAGSVWSVIDFTIGVDGDGTLTLADGGSVDAGAGTVVLASGAGSTGTLNIGDGGGAGSITANWLEFGAGTGTLNFNHDEDDYEFGIGIMGSGAINHLAGVTTLMGNGLSFTGTGTVSGGLLNVNSLFGGAWDVLSGGTLGGSGSVGDASVAAGGVLAPGNSIGTLSIANDIAFDAGSFFDVEVDAAGNSDLLLVGNTATINGGTVRVAPAAGSYAASTQYTILTANTVTGAFDAVTSSFAFLTPSLTYDAQNVFLTLDLTAAFQDVALTPNQFNTAGAAENLGGGNAIYDEILTMTEEEARAAFDALSGDAHASARTGYFHSARQIREALLARLRALSGGSSQTADAGYAPAAGDALPSGTRLWGQLFGATGETDGDGNAASLDRESYGFLGGVDRDLGEASRIGVALGYSRSDFDVDAHASSGESDNLHVAAYGGTKVGPVDLSGIVSYSYGSADTSRRVIVGGLTNNLTGDYDTQTVQAAIEAGTDLAQGSLVLTPFAGLAVIGVETDGFTEQGGPAALTVASASDTIGVSTLGLRARRESETVALSGSLAWRHAFGDTDPASRMAFASAPATPFTVRGVPVSENALALEAGAELSLGGDTTLSLGYAGEYGSDAVDHGLQLELAFRF
ncbi:autotransporter domain-containing protein, partial [Parvibaculum sp.]